MGLGRLVSRIFIKLALVAAGKLFFARPLPQSSHIVTAETLLILVGALLGGLQDDERSARLVDANGIDVVDDEVAQLALHVADDR